MRARFRVAFDLFGGLLIVAALLGAGVAFRWVQYRRIPHLTHSLSAGVDIALPFELIDRTWDVGLAHMHEKFVPHDSLENVVPFLQATAGASVAVVDYDRDGWPDVYFTNAALGSSNALYRNNHDGTFVDVTERAGIGKVNEHAASLRALFFDYDNDGFDDLLLTTTWCPRLFHNRGDGTFEEVTSGAGFSYCGFVTASNVIDYDKDGLLDVVIAGFYQSVDIFHPTTTAFLPSMHYAATGDGGPVRIYHNEGHGRFRDVSETLHIKSVGWVHAIGVYDLRGTGRQDLYLATDFNPDVLYWNDGGGVFREATGAFQDRKYSTYGMSAEIGDVDNSGRPAVFSTDEYEPGHGQNLNALWQITGGGLLQNRSMDLGVTKCGWSWGAKFIDFDNDTHLDLAVTNGFISDNPRKNYWYEDGVLQSANLATDAQNWPPMKDASMAGYEEKCVYYSSRGRMVDVSALTDMGHDQSDGRGLVAIDYRNEGIASLIEANVGQSARFYRNVPSHHNHWIGFDLKGTRSNRDAFGAVVTVKLADGTTQKRELEPANGYESESDRRLLFGLGPTPQIASIHIRWPLGAEQDLSGLAIDQYHSVTEP